MPHIVSIRGMPELRYILTSSAEIVIVEGACIRSDIRFWHIDRELIELENKPEARALIIRLYMDVIATQTEAKAARWRAIHNDVAREQYLDAKVAEIRADMQAQRDAKK